MNTNPLSHLSWRAAIKSYDSTAKLSDEQVSLLIQAARLSPTSFGLQPIKIYVVGDRETKNKLRTAGYNQPQFTAADKIFIFAARATVTKEDIDAYLGRIEKQRGTPKEELAGFGEMLLGSLDGKSESDLHAWATKQAYLALGFTLAVAAKNKIDTTPMEGFDNNAFNEILGIDKEGYRAVVAMSAGFRSSADKYSKMPKVRKETAEFATLI